MLDSGFLEDLYGLTISGQDGEVVFRFDSRKGKDAAYLAELVTAWATMASKYRTGEITKDDYDKWRYNYPKFDSTQTRAEIPSQELSDYIVENLEDRLTK